MACSRRHEANQGKKIVLDFIFTIQFSIVDVIVITEKCRAAIHCRQQTLFTMQKQMVEKITSSRNH